MHWEARRRVAGAIATAKTKAARQAIWIQVPQRWRELVGYNVALLLGTIIGTLPSIETRRVALDQVPDELRARVEQEVRRVFHLHARRSPGGA
jgi:hypothetical protein